MSGKLAVLGMAAGATGLLFGFFGAIQQWEEYPGKRRVEKILEVGMLSGMAGALALLIVAAVVYVCQP